MKKFLSLILALAMVACMSVTAFAADGTTTLTVEVPDNTPTYTLHVPANMTLEYGNTGIQTIGDVSVTDVEGYSMIATYVKYTNLINKDNTADVISLDVYGKTTRQSVSPRLFGAASGTFADSNSLPRLYSKEDAGKYEYDANGYNTLQVSAQVSDWSGATPGATYQATITYVVYTR